MKNERKQNLEYALEKIEEKNAWAKFLACNTRPDPRFEDQITTYISQEEEDLQAIAIARGHTLFQDFLVRYRAY